MLLRPIGPVETALMFRAETIGTNFALTLRLDGDLSPGHLSSALERLRTAYPFSAVRVETGPDGRLWWTSDGVPPYPVEVADPARSVWTEVVAREVQRPFEWRVGPLARFVVLRQGGTSDLICVFDHGTYDGLGASCFVRDLLRLLADREAHLSSSPVPPDPASLIPKSVRARARPRLFGVRLGVRALVASRRVRRWITCTAGGVWQIYTCQRGD